MVATLAYAVHTDACTYLLDEDGVCRWVTADDGRPPEDTTLAIGAQFVACFDAAVPGGLVGDLRPGTAALFVRIQDGRSVLLRTTPIRSVAEGAEAIPPDPPTRKLPPRPGPPRPSRRRGDADDTLTLVQTQLKRAEPAVLPPPPPRPSRRARLWPISERRGAWGGRRRPASGALSPTRR